MRNTRLLAGLAGLAGLLALVLTAATCFADTADAGKAVTITGEAKCAKCSLHQSDTCQTVIQTEKDGKTVTYYLADNDLSKGFHDNVCKHAKQVTATGTVTEKNGKSELTVTKIDVVK